MDVSKIGFLTGLPAELALLKGVGCMGAAGGGMPAGAAEAAARLIAEGAEALVSFGLAGGLNPAFGAGAILVPGAVIEGDRHYVCDAGLVAWLGGETCSVMVAGATIAASVAEKTEIFARTGADAIDLESGAVARVAAAAKKPFAVLRAVCDPAGRDLPPAALIALDGGGRIGILRVAASVLRRPGQVAGLLRLAGDAAKARGGLKARLSVLGAPHTSRLADDP